MFDHPRHRTRIQRAQLVAAHHGGDHSGVAGRILFVSVDDIVEIDGDLEQFRKFRIERAERIVDLPVADQHDLYVDRDAFGLQRYRAGDAHRFGDAFDPDFIGMQRAFQLLPRVALGQRFLGIQNQIAAVGPQQRPGLDQGKIGDQRAELRHVFDPPDQIGLGRVIVVDHRRLVRIGVVDQQVDLIAPEKSVHRRCLPLRGDGGVGAARLRLGRPARLATHLGAHLATGGDDKGLAVLDDIGADLIDIRHHFRQLGIGFLDVFDHRADDALDHLLVQGAHALEMIALPFRRRAHDLLQLLFQLADDLAGFLLLLLGQFGERLGVDDLALADRGQRDAHRRSNQGDLLLLRLFLQSAESALMRFTELLFQRFAPCAVIVAVELRRQGGAQIADQPVHVFAQGMAAAGRQLKRARPVGFLEIIDVAPVAWNTGSTCRLFQMPAHHGVLAGSGRAEGEKIIPLAGHRNAEFQRFFRPRLTQAFVTRRTLNSLIAMGQASFAVFSAAASICSISSSEKPK